MELKNILENIEKVEKDVLDYILNTEHCLFYWISDKAVQNFIKEYPDDYEDMFYLLVIDTSTSPTIRIYFEDHPDGVEYIERYAVLSTFKDSTKARWFEWNGMVKEKQIAEKEQQLEYYKAQLERTKEELEKLKS
jgi:hypothetical protein